MISLIISFRIFGKESAFMAQLLPGSAEDKLFSLCSLYRMHGYSPYKMNKFEEYDLYSRNKDFLISDSVITFTDGNGKLLALKPDVTLSIVKNAKDDGESVRRVYYNENVYRTGRGNKSFRELMQVGIECLGGTDDYRFFEVLRLASESLRILSERCALCVSHLGVLTEALGFAGVPERKTNDAIRLIGEKNRHELASFLRDSGVSEEKADLLDRLLCLRGGLRETLPRLTELLSVCVTEPTRRQFLAVLSALSEDGSLFLDFSVVSDIRYYNGFVFKGYIEGISESVLSGGQYDGLMHKMGRSSGAVGFAVYFDTVERLFRTDDGFDVDIFLLYDETCTPAEVGETVKRLTSDGQSVFAERSLPEHIRARRTVTMKEGKVLSIEEHT